MAFGILRADDRRVSLIVRFALLSAAAITVLGVVLGRLVASLIAEEAMHSAQRSTALVVHSLEDHGISAESFGRRLTDDEIDAVTDAVHDDHSHDAGVVRIKLYDLDGTLRYDTNEPQAAGERSSSEDLARAARGRAVGHVQRGDDSHGDTAATGALLEVYAPVRDDDGGVAGVAEVYLAYGETDARVGSSINRLYAVVGGGLAVLWLLLFSLVATASRRLRQSVATNTRLAYSDSLTGLANRRLLMRRLDQALGDAGGGRVGLLLLDLDRFKDVNDTLGHDSGDRLLQSVGPRLVQALPPGVTVARLGGDEFAVVLPDICGIDEARAIAITIAEAFDDAFELDDLVLQVEPSIGVAVSPDHARDAGALLKCADVAMYCAKGAAEAVAVFSADLHQDGTESLELLAALRAAIAAGNLELAYQPKVELRTGRVVGVEALVRWTDPVRGSIPPARFIPLAESTGLIRPLTRYVLDRACAQARRWLDAGQHVPVAVNVSARNLVEPDLVDAIAATLARHGLAPDLLDIEITESAVIEDPRRAEEVLADLAVLGVRVSIDDFGTGYSSLSHLRRLRLSAIKIDRLFIAALASSTSDALIVTSVVGLAHGLGLRVVAEGVETEAVADRLRGIGCDEAQGYLYAPPLPPERIDVLLPAPAPADATAPRVPTAWTG